MLADISRRVHTDHRLAVPSLKPVFREGSWSLLVLNLLAGSDGILLGCISLPGGEDRCAVHGWCIPPLVT